MSRGWTKASACCLQTTLSCAFLCHIVSLPYLSRSSLHRLAGLPCRLFLSYGLQLVTRVAKQVTTMKMGGKRPRGRPRLRWVDREQRDVRQHQLDAKLAHNREAWRKAIMSIDPGLIGKGEQPCIHQYATCRSLVYFISFKIC